MNEANKPEQQIWDLYLQHCKSEGKDPTASDFAAWAKNILSAS